MSLTRCRKPDGSCTFCRVATAPTSRSRNGIATFSATSDAQMVSLSTRATSGVVQASQPRTSASRLPGTSVMITVTGCSAATRRHAVSVTSMTSTTSCTPSWSHDAMALAKITGSSWYTGTTTDSGSRKSLCTGRYSAAGTRRTSQLVQRTRPSSPSGMKAR